MTHTLYEFEEILLLEKQNIAVNQNSFDTNRLQTEIFFSETEQNLYKSLIFSKKKSATNFPPSVAASDRLSFKFTLGLLRWVSAILS